MAKYNCPALVDCSRADAREVFEHAIADEHRCPGCNTLLVLMKDNGNAGGGGRTKVPLLAVGGLALVAVLAGGVYVATKKVSPPVDAAVAPASASAPLLVAPPPAAAASSGAVAAGMAPSEAETMALKQQGEVKLRQGDASGAEVAANQAAVNELMKSAIAKMSQGKLGAADEDLQAARKRDPKQSLVYYNIGVLRLRQGKTDEAIKSFEACFMAGFDHFDAMDKDRDLDPLRKDPRFVDLLARYRKPAT